MNYTAWLEHFRANSARQDSMDAHIDWNTAPSLTGDQRQAFIHSFQRFELGEGGEGERLLALADAAGDPVYREALGLLVREEQRHSALFGRALDWLEGPLLASHWSDDAFTVLRRSMGLRAELGLFLVAEAVAMSYFEALASHAPDPQLRQLGRRLATDERDHLRFQMDRLHQGFAGENRLAKTAARAALTTIAAGASLVMCIDHAAALHACATSPVGCWSRAMRRFHSCAEHVFGEDRAELGPLAPDMSADSTRVAAG